MAQYKIPQEVNVEDKIIGPFTLKGFAFVMAFTVFAIIFIVILSTLGLSFFPALIIGALLGSPILIAGFIPFNGKPLYTYSESFISYFMKPRQRAWKREPDKKISQKTEVQEDEQAASGVDESYVQPKESVESAEKEFEEIALKVDTGGIYGQRNVDDGPTDIFADEGKGTLKNSLEKARDEVSQKKSQSEPTVADVASVEPDKKFDYEKPDTSKYKIGRDNKS